MAEKNLKLQHQYNRSLLGFIPAMIIQKTVEKKGKIRLPERHPIKTVVMFGDISGFTKLSEFLSRNGTEGAEKLAFAINRYMELLVKAVDRSGGDIFKYAGDAMIVLWPPPTKKDGDTDTDIELTNLLRQAIQSALDIQTKLDNLAIVEGQKLSVKIGFGVGEVSILQVGGEKGRAEYLAVGDPLTQAFESEHHAESGGVVIVSRQVHERVGEFFVSQEIKEEGDGHHHSVNGPFYQILSSNKTGQSVQMKADALLLRTKITNEQIERSQKILKSYVPAAVIPFMRLDQEKWSDEIRRLTVLFISLGLDLSQVMGENGLDRLQQVITLVQKCVYKYQGSLNKFLMDDKGSTLIIIFGLPPMSHQDDPIRGVFTAVDMVNELKKINCSCSIGITTGVVFAGVVGTSGSRREYSALGDSVNLSARFMQAAIIDKDNKVVIDEETKIECEHKIQFKLLKEDVVKGQKGLKKFFIPILQQEQVEFNKFTNFRTHLYYQKFQNDSKIIGRVKEQKFILKNILKFLNPKRLHQTKCFLLTGEIGIGKTVLAKKVMDDVYRQIQKDNLIYKYNEKANFLVENIRPDIKTKKYNGIRFAIQSIFNAFAQRHNKHNNKIELVQEIFEQIDKDDNEIQNITLQFIYDIVGIECNIDSKELEYINLQKDFSFRKIINKFIVKLFNLYLECDQVNTNINEQQQQQQAPPLILCLDDMQEYDQESWKIVKKLLKHCRYGLYILCIVRDQFQSFDPFSNQLPAMVDCISDIESKQQDELLYIKMKITGLDFDSLENLIKSEKDCKLVSSDLIKLFMHKTNGNPLDTIHFIRSLDKGNYLEVTPTLCLRYKESLQKLIQLNEFIGIDIPISRVKVNGPILDNLLVVFEDKLDDSNCEKYLILKVASVIGLIFDSETLKRTSPFKNLISEERLMNILNELVRDELLEVLDEGDNYQRITYRFTLPFFRELVYQRMKFSQRRQLHQFVAEQLSTAPSSGDENYDQERLIFHWQMSAEKQIRNDDTNEQNDLSIKAKRSIILRTAQNVLSQTAPYSRYAILKKGFLDKKAADGPKWDIRFLVLSVRELKYYYSESMFLETPDEPLGSIPLEEIFNISPLRDSLVQAGRSGFTICAGSYMKKNVEKGIREFYFSAQTTEEVEDWLTFIELARTYAIYNQFVQKFGTVNFPLINVNDQEITNKSRNSNNNSFFNQNTTARKDDEIFQSQQFNQNGQREKKRVHSIIGIKQDFHSQGKSSIMLQQNEIQQSSQRQREHIKKRIDLFVCASLSILWSHIIETPSINIKNQLPLGEKQTQFMKANPQLYSVSDELKNDVDLKSVVNSQRQSFVVSSDPRLSDFSKNSSFVEQLNKGQSKLKESVEEEDDDEQEILNGA